MVSVHEANTGTRKTISEINVFALFPIESTKKNPETSTLCLIQTFNRGTG
jgi:hypothetical protein